MSKTYKRGTKRKLFLPFVGLGVGIVAVFGTMGYVESRNTKQREEDNENLNANILKSSNITYDGVDYVKKQNVKSYLFIGSDMSDTASVNEDFVKNGLVAKMADAIYLVVVDEDADSYEVLQLDRNTICDVHVLEVDGNDFMTTQAQLCTSFFYGNSLETASENTALSVSELLNGTEIDGYATISMESIPVINDLVGGVTVTLEDDLSDLDPELKKGETVTLNGDQAFIYVQSRMNADDGTNASRLLRQSGFIDAFMNQAKALAKKDGSFVNGVYSKLEDVMTSNISNSSFTKLLKNILDYENLGIVTLDGETKTGTVLDDGLEHEEFYPDQTALSKTILHLYYKEK